MGDGATILHVDDDPDFVDVTAGFLKRGSDRFTVETAASGADGLDRLSPAIDCIISDYDMPGLNGLEFLDAVRDRYPDLPFILFTGNGSEEVASEALSLGATDYLQKAVGTDQYKLLANQVRRAVGQFRTERELERKNDLLEKTQDLVDVGSWEYDPQKGDVYFTDKVYEIYGVDSTHDPEPEADIQQFYHPADRDKIRECVDRALSEGEPYDIEVRIIAADGTKKWVRTRADPQFEDGVCQRVRGTIRDITARKERERERERQNDRLEEFVAVVSQDLRTPLGTLSESLDLVESDDHEVLEECHRTVGRMERLIDGLVHLARDAEMRSATAPVQLAALARECARTTGLSDEALSITTDATVVADESRLRQLFESLFANSIEHGTAGGDAQASQDGDGSTEQLSESDDAVSHDGQATVLTVGRLDDGFYVADDRTGVPESEPDRRFRVGYSTADEGTGFGLPVVTQVAEEHGWASRVTESDEGGARFEITGVEFADD